MIADPNSTTNKFFDFFRRSKFNWTAVVILIAISIIIGFLNDAFFSVDNLFNILRQVSVIGIVSIGMTFVIISGGFDLSVGSTAAAAGAFASWFVVYDRFPVLKRKRNEKSGELSGGEQQMLVIGQALMKRAQLVLIDEPAQGLSPLLVNEVADTITGLKKDGATIILVEHNLRLGLSIADKIYVLENGKIAFEANSTDLSGVEYAKKIYLGG